MAHLMHKYIHILNCIYYTFNGTSHHAIIVLIEIVISFSLAFVDTAFSEWLIIIISRAMFVA